MDSQITPPLYKGRPGGVENISGDFLKTLLHYIKSTYLPPKRHNPKYPDTFTSGDLHFFAPEVAELSAAFTFERSSRHANYFNRKEARASYLLYFLIPNMLKVEWILRQQHLAKLFAHEPEVRIADIGCGPCTGLLAAVHYWLANAPQQHLRLVGVDQNGPMLKDGKNLLDQLATFRVLSPRQTVALPRCAANSSEFAESHIIPFREYAATGALHSAPPGRLQETTVETLVANITTSELRKKLGSQKFHLLILANVLNEFGSMAERYKFVRGLMEAHLEPNGRLLIVEPALQRATRDLMTLRDELIVGYDGQPPVAQVLAPCLHQALCPMRANNPRDWCHSYINWERPQVIADLDMLIGNKKDYLKMSYMVMIPCAGPAAAANRGFATVRSKLEGVCGVPCSPVSAIAPTGALPLASPAQGNIYRVVSAPMKSKGKLEILFCGQKDGRLLRVTRLDKDRSTFNIALDQLQRGDLVDYAGEAKCGRETVVADYAAR